MSKKKPTPKPTPKKKTPEKTPKPKKPPAGDGQTVHSVGSESPHFNAILGLVRDMWGLESVWEFHAPDMSPAVRQKLLLGVVGDTGNHRGLYRAYYFLWAMRAGTPEQKAESIERLAEFFRLMTRLGFQYDEFLNTSHGQLWLQLVLGARAGALHYNVPVIVEFTSQYLRQFLYCCKLLSVGPRVHLFGARSEVSEYELHNAFYALMLDEPIPDDPRKPNHKFNPDDAYNASYWIARELIARGDDLGGTIRGQVEQPVFSNPLYIRRVDSFNWTAWWPHIRNCGKPVLWWTSVQNGQSTDAPPWMHDVSNMDCPEPLPPVVEGADLIVIPGIKEIA